MQTVYQAAHGLEAQIVVDVLAGEGIDAIVTGAGLLGAAGDLPVMGVVQVRVADEDAGRAMAVIAAWKATPVPADDEPEASAAPSAPRPRYLRVLLAGAAIGALATFAAMHPWARVDVTDRDRDGRAEARLTRVNDRVVRAEYDRDDDGRIDRVVDYGRSDRDYLLAEDRNLDGHMETEARYVGDMAVSARTDDDGDGFNELETRFRHGDRVEEEWTDPRTRAVVLRRHYDGAVATTSEIDSDGDGRLDTRRHHAANGEITASEPFSASGG